MTPLDLLKLAFAAYLTFDFVRYLRSGKLRRHLSVFRGWRGRDWLVATLGNLLVLAAVITVGLTLIALSPRVLGWSWLRLLARPGEEAQATNLMTSGLQVPWFGFLFVGLLLLNLPRLARREEEIFRRGTEGGRDALVRSVKFGLIHCVVGVPIGIGLALSLGGLWFTWHYWRGRVRRAAFMHTVYNTQIVLILAVALVMAAVSSGSAGAESRDRPPSSAPAARPSG